MMIFLYVLIRATCNDAYTRVQGGIIKSVQVFCLPRGFDNMLVPGSLKHIAYLQPNKSWTVTDS